MILYFDTYITETARSENRKLASLVSEVRSTDTAYKFQSKYNIFKYTLSSYSYLNWKQVLINVSGDDDSNINEIIKYSNNLFPNLQINKTRSDTGIKYCKIISNNFINNPWIFFAPHNDHVFISYDLDIINRLKILAEKYESITQLPVVILYSHYTESINSINKKNYLYNYTNEKYKIIGEDEDAYILLKSEIPLLSTHIIRSNILFKLMSIAKEKEVITTESIGSYIKDTEKCIQIIPKKEICRHYDGYMHTFSVVNDYLSAEKVPPLFIPDGFFNNNIIINYGFDEYIKSTVNINPYKDDYIFRKYNGTDIGDLIKNIPHFWKDKISEININPRFVEPPFNKIELANKIINPWRKKSSLKIRVILLYRNIKFLFLESSFGVLIIKMKIFIRKTNTFNTLRKIYRFYIR